jgi:hypothetical protein
MLGSSGGVALFCAMWISAGHEPVGLTPPRFSRPYRAGSRGVRLPRSLRRLRTCRGSVPGREGQRRTVTVIGPDTPTSEATKVLPRLGYVRPRTERTQSRAPA